MPSASKPSAAASTSRSGARSSHRATVVAATATFRSSRSQRVTWTMVAPARRRATSSGPWRSSFDRRCPLSVPPERRTRLVNQLCFRKNFAANDPSVLHVLVLLAAPRGKETTSAIASSDSVPGSPPFRPLGRGRDCSRRCRWLSRRVAARDASAASRPCRVRHGCAWTPGSADGSHRLLRHYGLLARTVCCRDRPARLRGRQPAGGVGGLLPHRRRIAALPLRDRRAVRSPRGSCLRSGTSPWPAGNRVYGQSALRSPEGRSRSRFARMSPRRRPPSTPVRFVPHGTCRVLTRRSRVRVPRFRRRCAASLV